MTSDDPGVADPRDDDLSAYDYELPAERIATRPPADRDGGRLLTLPRDGGPCGHRSVRDLPELLSPGDVLVLNDSRVLKARLFGVRTETGGRWEGLFLDAPGDGLWRLMSRTKGKIRPGETVTLRGTDAGDGDPLRLEFREKERDGVWRAAPTIPGAAETLLDAFGHTPLPPYIRDGVADETDDERYQTVYAAEAGSVAAPTAGLHFTEDMLARCRSRGVCVVSVTLHVGAGTFKPISADRLADHRMHSERFSISAETGAAVTSAKAAGGRVVAVGTTATRVLESAWDRERRLLKPVTSGVTDLFLRPGDGPRFVDGLVTNFHLPKSSLIVLVAAFAGRERVLAAYREAIERGYRFYSYGDASLVL